MIHTLEADNIQLTYNNRRILSDIYLKCETGMITGLLGSNGSGKSSLMNIMYGSLRCEKSVRIDDKRIITSIWGSRVLTYLPQFNFIPKTFSIKRILTDFEISLFEFLERFPEFVPAIKSPIGLLSGGERRFIELYVILNSNSQFALLDEPFTHLNPIQIEKVKNLLLEIKRNKGLLITDHMFNHIREVCDNIYVLKNGKTHLTKNVDEIKALGYV